MDSEAVQSAFLSFEVFAWAECSPLLGLPGGALLDLFPIVRTVYASFRRWIHCRNKRIHPGTQVSAVLRNLVAGHESLSEDNPRAACHRDARHG
jgi:hypothetical protein